MRRLSATLSLLAGCALAHATTAPPVVPREHPALHQLVMAPSEVELLATITHLVGFGTRHTLSDTTSTTRGIGAARRWVKSRFAAISKNCGGCIEVVTPAQVFTGKRAPQSVEVMDVVAIKRGKRDPQRVIMMTGHLDSRVTDVMNITSDAPGANDDASGVAALIEAARVLSTLEQADYRRYHGGEVDSPSRNLARTIERLADDYLPDFKVRMVYRTDRFGRGGDQVPFLQAGFPAVRVTEAHEDYTRQHQDLRTGHTDQDRGVRYGDTLDGIDFRYLARVTALNAITMAALGRAPAPPTGVTIEGALATDTTVHWNKVPGAAGYRVHWRDTTAAQWQHARAVGNVDHTILKNVVIDDWFFGVSAVSADGYESPVVFPGFAGSFERSPAPAASTATH